LSISRDVAGGAASSPHHRPQDLQNQSSLASLPTRVPRRRRIPPPPRSPIGSSSMTTRPWPRVAQPPSGWHLPSDAADVVLAAHQRQLARRGPGCLPDDAPGASKVPDPGTVAAMEGFYRPRLKPALEISSASRSPSSRTTSTVSQIPISSHIICCIFVAY
jgi:hypothetical protein